MTKKKTSKKTSKNKSKPTTDASAILTRRFGDAPDRRAEIDQIKQDLAIGSQIARPSIARLSPSYTHPI